MIKPEGNDLTDNNYFDSNSLIILPTQIKELKSLHSYKNIINYFNTSCYKRVLQNSIFVLVNKPTDQRSTDLLYILSGNEYSFDIKTKEKVCKITPKRKNDSISQSSKEKTTSVNNIEQIFDQLKDKSGSKEPNKCLCCLWEFPVILSSHEINTHMNQCFDGKGEQNKKNHLLNLKRIYDESLTVWKDNVKLKKVTKVKST